MKRAILLFGVMVPLLVPVSPCAAQFRKLSRNQKKRMEKERKYTLKELKAAIRAKDGDDAIHQMDVLMRLYCDAKSAKEVARSLVKVLETRFHSDEPKMFALKNLKDLGEPGIKELERALLTRLRRQPVFLRLRAIATLVEARQPSSWKILLRLSQDRDPHVAVAAIRGLAGWKDLPVRERREMVRKIEQKLRPPTKEEIAKDLDLPPVQRALREVLSNITGRKLYTVKEWKKFLVIWNRQGCPVAEAKKKQCPRNSKKDAVQKGPSQGKLSTTTQEFIRN